MSKYIFYVAFFYLCYYAGNKAFPPSTLPTNIQVRPAANTDSAKTHAELNVQQAEHELPKSPGIKQEINEAITGSHILFLTMSRIITGNINIARDSIIRELAKRSLALLNEVNN